MVAVTMPDVLAALNREEPDYSEAASALGPQALPHLKYLVENSGDILLASKAAFLSTLIPAEESLGVLEAAARRESPEVRVAAAAGAKNLMGSAGDVIQPMGRRPFQRKASQLLISLLADPDVGVRRAAQKSVQAQKNSEAMGALQDLATTLPDAKRDALNALLVDRRQE